MIFPPLQFQLYTYYMLAYEIIEGLPTTEEFIAFFEERPVSRFHIPFHGNL